MTQHTVQSLKALLPVEIKVGERRGTHVVKGILTVPEAEAQDFKFRGATADTVILVLDRGYFDGRAREAFQVAQLADLKVVS